MLRFLKKGRWMSRFSIIVLQSCVFFIQLRAQNLSQYVNPFVGTNAHGHTFPGATTPFGMVQLSPDTRVDGSWDGCSGYHYSDSMIYGFSHTHLSGTGCSDYGDIAFLPIYINKTKDKMWRDSVIHAHYSHSSEIAEPGYYSVVLNKRQIKVELSATKRTGIQKYTYASEGYTFIYLNLKHRDELIQGRIVRKGIRSFGGSRRSAAWARDQLIFYHFEISKTPDKIEIDSSSNGHTQLRLGFKISKGESILIKTALSSVSEQGALLNLNSEMPHWDFDKVRKEANSLWNNELSRIKVYGGSLVEKQNFYTALYHCMMHPNVMNDVDGTYRGRDNKIHKSDKHNYYTVFSLWDTYRAQHPLLNIIDPVRSRDFMYTFRSQFEQGGRLPMWELWGNETNCMIGFHSVSVILDAYRKGVISIKELAELYPAAKAEAMSARSGLDKFREKGFLSVEDESESVSKTLEYSYDMWCMSEIAGEISSMESCQDALQMTDDANMFRQYANGWINLRDDKSDFMIPRVNGGWIADFDPRQVNNHFTEANAWQYRFAVQHNLNSVASDSALSAMFNMTSLTTGREQSDITGLIGQYAHGNEPSHHFAYLFGSTDSVSKYVSRICREFYHPGSDGLCGNEDCGQMSAWYVFSAMGFYPVLPGSNEMVFGHMIFDSICVDDGENTFTIYRHPPKNIDFGVKSPRFSFDRRRDICFEYASIPYQSAVRKNNYTSAPVIHSVSRVFSDSLLITIDCNGDCTESDKLRYTTDGSAVSKDSKLYDPQTGIMIRNSCKIRAKVFRSDESHFEAVANFYKKPNQYKVTLLSKYNKQYTAGGDQGLLDGLKGDTDWRKGGWQGYQGVDFEAVIDLNTVMTIDTVVIGFLEDRRSWIFLPDHIELLGSADGVNYESFQTLDFLNYHSREMTLKRVDADFSFPAGKYNYRYIKVRAVNFGKLPDWHPGAGGDAFIFIDEIEIL